MKTACLSLLMVTCFLINKTNAQVGYIITQKGDTIKGEINIGVFGGGKFKAVGQSDYMPVKIDTLKEYQLSDSSVFVLKRIPRSTANMFSKPQILQRIEHGRINLYQYVPPAGDPIITWYASKGTDSLITIKTSDIFLAGGGSKKKRMAILSNMFADEPDVQAAFNTTRKFDFNTIQICIRRYNKAAGSTGK